jgi:hypothetical protein
VTITIPAHKGNSSLWTGPSRRRKRDERDANRQAKEQRPANLHLKPHMLLGSHQLYEPNPVDAIAEAERATAL